MIKNESAFDLFQRLNIKDDNRYQTIINRLNHYYEILYPNTHQIIELLDNNRRITKEFIHDFISNYIDYMNYRNQLLYLPLESEEMILNSPQANKSSTQSNISTLDMKFHSNQSVIFLYIDSEYKECPFNQSEFIQWYDCETSTELISTLLRFEHSYFIPNPNQHYILIIDSSTQVCMKIFILEI